MEIAGRSVAQSSLEINLSRRIHQQIRAANDVGDPLFGIVDHYRELVRVKPVGAAQNEVADFCGNVLCKPSEGTIKEYDLCIVVVLHP